RLFWFIAAVALIALPMTAGEWHTGSANLCTDCHTMHFSQSHKWASGDPIGTVPDKNGDWLGTTGPNHFLLKAPANDLCLSCHDGQTFAPDVLMANTNAASVTFGREAGALNDIVAAEGYEAWMGHTLDSTSQPPGKENYNGADPYPAGTALECTNCHTQHGVAGVYRNIGPRNSAHQPTYVISTTNDNTKDVWVNIASGYVANSGDPATFSPYYDASNVTFNRNDATDINGKKTSNKIDTQCSVCHGVFHGGQGDSGIGGVPEDAMGGAEFLRHPTSQEILNTGGHGTSNINRFKAAVVKVKVYADDRVDYADATPGCVTSHKAHGNKNPFGLVFQSRTATGSSEEGDPGTEVAPAGAPGYQKGYRALCGQCHGQGS
ncbi:MAG TPA: cytochrome c3 family protein, partial [Nonomuraea sp.]|nr:cytochrome c3 family protein [Nonomuraea sp.]